MHQQTSLKKIDKNDENSTGADNDDVISQAIIDQALAARIKFENYYKNLIRQSREREERYSL